MHFRVNQDHVISEWLRRNKQKSTDFKVSTASQRLLHIPGISNVVSHDSHPHICTYQKRYPATQNS